MAYVFISHASEDKPRVRPLAKALALEGVQLWLDRPGHGPSHFNFDRDFIVRHNIRELQSGKPWPEQLSVALREASAVLLCISKSLCKERAVLSQEIAIGVHSGKLTACIVDDLAEADLRADLGLVDLSKIQTERIDTALLDRATSEIESGRAPALLTAELKGEWERVMKLKADIRAIFERFGVDSITLAEVKQACEVIARYPIAPAVAFHEIPAELVELFADRFHHAAGARRHVTLAMNLRMQCNAERFEERQILVSIAEVPPPESTPPLQYWSQVFSLAGMKSRRTLAALLVVPGAPSAELSPVLARRYADFLCWLAKPTT